MIFYEIERNIDFFVGINRKSKEHCIKAGTSVILNELSTGKYLHEPADKFIGILTH